MFYNLYNYINNYIIIYIMNTINSIKQNNLIFISAQPDNNYFHWQVAIYLNQFESLSIKPFCYAIFCYDETPSKEIKDLKKRGYNIFWYKDTRKDKTYIPNIRPHVLSKFFKQYPHLGKNVFYHDSDILFYKLPKFELLLNDNICYLSDTISYIGSDYIIDCGKRYNDRYPDKMKEDTILEEMCKIVNINSNIVKHNNNNSGGAQYLIKNIHYSYFNDIEENCNKLYDYFNKLDKQYPIDHSIQKWTTGMWCDLWELWKRNKQTRIHDELSFSWATYTIEDVYKHNIFHLAGVTEENNTNIFYKAKYINKKLLSDYTENDFDFVSKDSATYFYVTWIINTINKYHNDPYRFTLISKNNNQNNNYLGEYYKATNYTLNNKPYYIHVKKHCFIGWNNNRWILTGTQWLIDIVKTQSKTFGGFYSNTNFTQNIIDTTWDHFNIQKI